MSTLLMEKGLREADEDDEVRILARARTVTVLARLEADRWSEEDSGKEQVVEFLIEAGLVQGVNGKNPIVSLEETDLDGVGLDAEDLGGAILTNAELRFANLRGADLRGVNLEDAELLGAELDGTRLRSATMPDGSRHPRRDPSSLRARERGGTATSEGGYRATNRAYPPERKWRLLPACVATLGSNHGRRLDLTRNAKQEPPVPGPHP